MSKNTEKQQKRSYESPLIDKIDIDKDISLQLTSLPPTGPNNGNNLQHNVPNDPFKQNMA